jgi:putative N6-adenine-specific DNA methylase
MSSSRRPKYTTLERVTRYTLVATASFGLEAVVRAELSALGCAEPRTEDRRVVFQGSAEDVARCNIRLRTADRVLLRLSEFPVEDFDDLYEGVRAVRWRDLLAPSPAVVVEARSARSKISSVPAIQSVSKKAIVDALSKGASSSRMAESGPRYSVEVAIAHDSASISLDTTGPGLHKRGYRAAAGEAPLRENLAAALVLLSRWDAPRPFADPLCGSGTIPIEAALIAGNIAPGINRRFAAEEWPVFPRTTWKAARDEARSAERRDAELRIDASDRDAKMVETARRNAERAGVGSRIGFRAAPLERFTPAGDFGCMVCNPPYGERLGEAREVEELYRAMGKLSSRLDTWSLFVLTAHEGFQKLFGSRATKNRKLYNGNLRCWFYQYFGPLPPAPPRPFGTLGLP